MSPKNRSNEIRITRIYDAPVKVVWDAWTDPEQVAQWWGPRGFTITTHSKDLRSGGSWAYTMHGPDGVDYPNKTIYLEVDKYSRLVYDHGGNDDRPPLFRVTVLFHDLKGKTKMEMSMALPTPEAADEARKFIKKAGGDGTWDRLGEYLAKTQSDKEQFIINRSFAAPLQTVFDMWTNPKHMEQWLPPTGFTMKHIEAAIKPGSTSFYVMTGSNGMKMYGKIQYLEIKPFDHLVYTQQFCDENQKLARHPLAPTWPATMLTRVTFTEEEPDQTRVTVVWECHGATTPEEMDTFIKGRAGMSGGWTGSFDKLEGYLAGK
ncbi:MAG: SRPBCC family protein [Oligoflexales bacterium]